MWCVIFDNVYSSFKGAPTNFGLNGKTLKSMEKSCNENYVSTYKSSFKEMPKEFYVVRHYSSPKSLSSHFNSNNKLNKDLDLRNVRVYTSQEHPPNKLLLSA